MCKPGDYSGSSGTPIQSLDLQPKKKKKKKKQTYHQVNVF